MTWTFRSSTGVTWWLKGTHSETPNPGSFFLSACNTGSVLQDWTVRHVSPQPGARHMPSTSRHPLACWDMLTNGSLTCSEPDPLYEPRFTNLQIAKEQTQAVRAVAWESLPSVWMLEGRWSGAVKVGSVERKKAQGPYKTP